MGVHPLRFERRPSVVVGLTSTALTVAFAGLAVYGLTRFPHVVSQLGMALVLIAAGFAGCAFFTASTGIRLLFALATVLSILAAIRVRRYGGGRCAAQAS
jgi:hypothetical protein